MTTITAYDADGRVTQVILKLIEVISLQAEVIDEMYRLLAQSGQAGDLPDSSWRKMRDIASLGGDLGVIG